MYVNTKSTLFALKKDTRAAAVAVSRTQPSPPTRVDPIDVVWEWRCVHKVPYSPSLQVARWSGKAADTKPPRWLWDARVKPRRAVPAQLPTKSIQQAARPRGPLARRLAAYTASMSLLISTESLPLDPLQASRKNEQWCEVFCFYNHLLWHCSKPHYIDCR